MSQFIIEMPSRNVSELVEARGYVSAMKQVFGNKVIYNEVKGSDAMNANCVISRMGGARELQKYYIVQ